MTATVESIQTLAQRMHLENRHATASALIGWARGKINGPALETALDRFHLDPTGPDGEAFVAWLQLLSDYAGLVRDKTAA